jgi:hypothetical protein
MSDLPIGFVLPPPINQNEEQLNYNTVNNNAQLEDDRIPGSPVYTKPDDSHSDAPLLAESQEKNDSKMEILELEPAYNTEPLELAEQAKLRTFYQDEASSEMKRIDYVLVYQVQVDESKEKDEDEEQKEKHREIFLKNLEQKGLQFRIIEEKELMFVLCHAPDELLKKWAEILRMRMPLKEADHPPMKNLWGRLWESFPSVFEPFDFHDEVEDKMNPYCYFTAMFTEAREDRFALKQMGMDNFFTVADRNRIVHNILSRTEYGALETNEEENPDDYLTKKFGIDHLIQDGVYTAAYPLHDGPYEWDDIAMGSAWTESGKLMNERQKLFYSWASWRTWYKKQPMERIRSYFGEKIALYFAWLGFYTWFLFPPAVLGVLCFIYGIATSGDDEISQQVCDGPAGNYEMCPLCDKGCDVWTLGEACTNLRVSHWFDNKSTILFAVVMALWGTLFLEFWKRKQNELAYEWDLFDYETGTQVIRPQFELKAKTAAAKAAKAKEAWWQVNPITMMTEPFMPLSEQIPKLSASISTVVFMVCVVVMAVVAVIVYRTFVGFQVHSSSSESIRKNGSLITSATASFLSLVVIQILSRVYQKLAIFLTDYECPRTETQYEDSYTMKMFVFQFVNYYSAIFYVAFFKGRFVGYPGNYNKIFGVRQEECQPGGCLLEVTIQLGFIMVGKQIMNNCAEIAIPVMKAWWARRKLANQDGGNDKSMKERLMTQWQADYCLIEQPPLNLFYEYLEMVIQFGFTTLFVAAFPLAPLFAFLNNVIEIKLDAYKFVTQNRRPWAEKAEDIGSWFSILEGIAIIAVITNALIIANTSTVLLKLYYKWFYTGSYSGDNEEYTDFTLTIANYTAINPELASQLSGDLCRYQDFRTPATDPNPYVRTKVYYELLAMRLAFVLIFENFVFAIKQFIAYLVPDMPGHVQSEKAREDYVTKQVLYDAEKAADLRLRKKEGVDESGETKTKHFQDTSL